MWCGGARLWRVRCGDVVEGVLVRGCGGCGVVMRGAEAARFLQIAHTHTHTSHILSALALGSHSHESCHVVIVLSSILSTPPPRRFN
jgi:hypothetical protein